MKQITHLGTVLEAARDKVKYNSHVKNIWADIIEEKGIEEGTIKTLISLVEEDILTIEDAAKRAGLTKEEFEKHLMEK